MSNIPSPPSNAVEISFTAAQLDYLRIIHARKLEYIKADLRNPVLVGPNNDPMYNAPWVEAVLHRHLGTSPDPVHPKGAGSSQFTVHSSPDPVHSSPFTIHSSK
jgi:hypothetical protein